ncbi:MAG TPA: tRNA-dihydrouridine synthase family protein, partial [Candidatus Paceibacterota bacterium]|nr:tRNA-dihydrouridine synthase family protein [Candidatus Paceibacterota bacterium]
ITWTEFVSADGLYHTREMKKMRDEENPLMRDLQFDDAERPIVAQLFTSKPEMMAYAAKLAAELGFDGIDINMGCPDESIEKQGSGAAMIQAPEVAQAVIRAAKESGLPVSVKTRVGYSSEILDEWLPALFEAEPVAVTLHLRTRKEMSVVPARWDLMQKAVALRDRFAPGILMLGNGDVKSLAEAKQKAEETGADGVMIGRGMFGNFWVFAGRKPEDVSKEEKLAALVELAHEYEKLAPAKPFHILKKHVKAFVSGFDGAAELRGKLMETNGADELERAISENRL